MTLTHNLTIEPEGVLQLAPPFWGKPRMACVLVGYLELLQEVEDQFWTIIDGLDVDTCGRWVLDRLAKIVGETSRPDDTEALRTLVRGRILANRSSGTLPELYEICSILFTDPGTCDELDLDLLISTPDPGASVTPYAARLLDQASAGTVRLVLHTTGTFAWPAYGDASPPSTGAVGTGTWSSAHVIA